MFKAITNLFATPKTTKPTTRKATLGFESMETRDAPAVLYTGSIRSFDPQPEPPLNTIVQVGTTRGIVVVGG